MPVLQGLNSWLGADLKSDQIFGISNPRNLYSDISFDFSSWVNFAYFKNKLSMFSSLNWDQSKKQIKFLESVTPSLPLQKNIVIVYSIFF